MDADDPMDAMSYRISGEPMWYDRLGQPITIREANDLLADPEARIVKQEHIGAYYVSTVHLVLNHNFMGGPPLIFETMVFDHDGTPEPDWLDHGCIRATTEHAALSNHDQLAAAVRDHAATGSSRPRR